MNEVILIGRLTKDAELRFTKSNKACATFDLAINNGKDRPADFIKVVAWEKTAENIAKYTRKGSQIAVTGSIKNESWEDEQGNKKYRTYVLARKTNFLESKKSDEPLPQEPEYVQNNTKDPFEQMASQIEIDDNDLPF